MKGQEERKNNELAVVLGFIKCILNILELNKGLNLMFPASTDGIS